MKNFTKILAVAFLAVFLVSGSVWALPIVPGSALQDALDGITTSPAGNSSINVSTDYISDTTDSYWNLTASGGSVATMIFEIAGFAGTNKFGVYNGDTMVELFNGSNANPDQTTLTIMADGTVKVNQVVKAVFTTSTFGYYLDSRDETDPNLTGGLFFSDTSKNTDNFDHMFAYQGNDTDKIQIPGYNPGTWTDNEFLLAWEDVFGGGDKDFNDFVVMVESVEPVPEPATMLLLGSGLAGMGIIGRRKKKA